MVTVGVDWGETDHAVTVLDGEGRVVEHFRVGQTKRGLDELVKRLRAHGPAAEIPIGIERPDGIVVDALVAAGHPIVPLHPNAVKATRSRYRAAPGKSDRDDSYIIADIVRTDGHRFRRLRPLSDAMRAMRALVRSRADLLAERVCLRNQLAAILASFWPGAAQIFSDVDSAIALAFLEKYPEPAAAAELGPAELRSFLKAHRYSGHRDATQLLSRLRAAPVGRAATSETRSKRRIVLTYVTLLRALRTEMRSLEAEIHEAIHQHADGNLLLSLPAVAETNAAQILAELTDDRSRFASRDHLAAESGIAPVTKQSGKGRSVSFRWACNGRLRAALTTFANNSRRRSTWAALVYTRARQRGHSHPHAIRILARAWIGVLWRLWLDRRPYDPVLHGAALQMTGG